MLDITLILKEQREIKDKEENGMIKFEKEDR